MNTFLAVGLGTAAVVVAFLIGSNLQGSSSPPPGGEPPASTAPSADSPSAEPSTPADGSLPVGSTFAWFDPTIASEPRTDLPSITVTIPASGWTCGQGYLMVRIGEGAGRGWAGSGDQVCTLIKGGGLDGLDRAPDGRLRESALQATVTTKGIHVYEDACQWGNLVPGAPATTADEIAAALAAQPSRDASDPVDVAVGGYPGKEVTLHVPDDIRNTDGTFTDCFRGLYASYTTGEYDAEGTLPTRWHQGPGQIDTFWIVEVDGAIVIISAMYRPDTSAERIEEMRAIVESATLSATFE
jgi:hypothetical protein